jgi:hypothetical protein
MDCLDNGAASIHASSFGRDSTFGQQSHELRKDWQ